MDKSNVVKALVAMAMPSFLSTDYMDSFQPIPNAKPYRLAIPHFIKTQERPALVYCLEGTVLIGRGRFAVRKRAHKVWYVEGEAFIRDTSGLTDYRPKSNCEIMWPNVVLGQTPEKVMRRFSATLARYGVPVMR